MKQFSKVEDTLFVPMLGRIWCSHHFPNILHDKKALELSQNIPVDISQHAKGSEYTKVASAVRSTNMDRHIQDFMKRCPEGVIVQIGCGLETTFYRNDDGKHHWIELDLPEVIEFRKKVLGENERDRCLVADATTEEWIQKVRNLYPDQPLLVTSSGVFYYFTEKMVMVLMGYLKKWGNAELVFDTVNKAGMKQMHKHMRTVGHEEAEIFFYVEDGKELAKKVGAELIQEEVFYAHTPVKGLSFMTQLFIRFSDWMRMVKMIHLKF